MGEIINELGRRRRDANGGQGPQGNGGRIGMKTAEQLLADHRAAQGFGVPSGGETPGNGSGGAGGGSGGPPGGMVNPTPAQPDIETGPVARPRRRPGRGGFGGASINL